MFILSILPSCLAIEDHRHDGTHRPRPRESRSPNASRATPRRPTVQFSFLPIRSIVKQQSCHATPMPGIPDGNRPTWRPSRRWGDRFAPSRTRERLGRSLLPRATCCLISVIVHADLLVFRLDPQTARRDPTSAESRHRTRARPANAGRAEISKWEIDGRFHDESFALNIYRFTRFPRACAPRAPWL